MADYRSLRPKKKVFGQTRIKELRILACKKFKSKILPDEQVDRIVLIGSSVNNTFGEYAHPGFRKSLFSDFDFVVFVANEYSILSWLNREIDGKPFEDDKLNLAFRSQKFIETKYDIEVFFVRRSSTKNKKIVKFGEAAGIPMTPNSKNKHIVIYEI